MATGKKQHPEQTPFLDLFQVSTPTKQKLSKQNIKIEYQSINHSSLALKGRVPSQPILEPSSSSW
jgi:hypothetical protein